MIRMIHPERAFVTNFSPVAEITLPMQVFMRRGFEFMHDEDGHDYAAFLADACGLALLQHNRNADHETISLFLPDDSQGLSDLAQTFMRLSEELEIPAAAFHWRQNGEEVSLAPSPRVAA